MAVYMIAQGVETSAQSQYSGAAVSRLERRLRQRVSLLEFLTTFRCLGFDHTCCVA